MATPPNPNGAPAPADPFEPYLNRASALFDLGDVVQAGQIWQAILKRDPHHQAARAGLYKVKVHFDARATQDGLVVPAPPEPEPRDLPARDQEVDRLLEEGCARYDAGRTDEAVAAWERVQALDPGNHMARGYLEGARRKLEKEAASTGALPTFAAQAEAEAEVAREREAQDLERNDRLLRDGCTLFDMGQVADALRKWEQILASTPDHALALAYANDARRELGQAPGEPAAPPMAAPSPERAPAAADQESEVERLVLDGVQLYDMGMPDEAVEKWQRALERDPSHGNAAEYLRMAERDRQLASPAAAAPPRPAAPMPIAVPALATQIQEAERLLRSQRFDEAVQAFQWLLEAHPEDPRIQHGHQQARALLAAETQRPAPVLKTEPQAPPKALPAPIGPPRAVTARAVSQRQGGLKVPANLKGLAVPAWLTTPRNLGITAGVAAVLGLGLYFTWDRLRETALKQAVRSAKADAMKPVSRQLEVSALAETPQAIRQEAEAALSEDPLLAYCRSQEWLRLEPGNAAAAQLVDQAKGRLAALPQTGDLAELQKSVQAGDLEAAAHTLRGLLGQNPDDPGLRSQARMVDLARAQQFAGKERFDDAKACLLRIRAMYPQEKIWQAKLMLLETIQTMPKAERPGWIQMLG